MGMISYAVPNVFLNEFQFQRGIISVLKWDSLETSEIKPTLSAWLMRDRYDFGVVVVNDVSLDWRLFF